MARNNKAAAPRAGSRTPFFLAAVFLALAAAVAASYAFGVVGAHTPSSSAGPNITFTTEDAQGAPSGVANSPLKISVRIPRADGTAETLLFSANLQLLDEKGQPAVYGGQPGGPTPMKAGSDLGTWEYNGSVPSVPGVYHTKLEWQALPQNDQTPTSVTQTVELETPQFTAKPETGPPMTGGYVFARDSNLWMLSTDMKKQRRLTFFPAYYEYADNPAWSPDGKSIAFAYSPRVAANEIPATNIWTINPDGTGGKQWLEHGPDESLYNPTWSPDGRYLYFTTEKSAMSSTVYNAAGMPVGERHLDRLELATGVRTQWIPLGTMPSCCGDGDKIAYLEDVTPEDPNSGVPSGQRLILTDLKGTARSVLVDERTFAVMNDPSVSPDGKWVVFGAINPPTPLSSRPDPLGWLLFAPETAYAHGSPWDLYMVSTQGGKPVRLTNLQEDQPHGIWIDNSTIALMGVRGLYKVQIGSDGKPTGDALKVHEGAPHGGLTWHAP